jgi:hypothetical protein
VDDYVEVPHSDSLNITLSITIMAWINPDTLPDVYGDIVSKSSPAGGSTPYRLCIDSAGKYRVFFDGLTPAQWYVSASSIVLGSWQQIAVVYDGSNLRLYFNGIEDANSPFSVSGNIFGNTRPLDIGALNDGGIYKRFLNGTIDEVRIWNRALSAEEIAESYYSYLEATSEWWNGDWSRRKPITIDNTANNNTLLDYQVLVNVTYDSDMNANFSDLRFVSAYGEELSYWIEDKVDSSYANVWVKVKYIPKKGYHNCLDVLWMPGCHGCQ